jgi:hypothetical protein
MIVMRLKGGLGNQMFQYALGRRLSIDHHTPLILETSSFNEDHLRDYRLNTFQIDASASDKLLFFPTTGPKRHINTVLQFFRSLLSGPFNIFKEQYFGFDPRVLQCSANAFFDGFWQSEQYFLPIRKTLLADFLPVQVLSGQLAQTVQQIDGSPAVSIHVRRSDYVSNPTTMAFHGVCSKEWYEEAAHYMKAHVPNVHFFVFSDDYEWAKNNLAFDAPTTFVKPSPDGLECHDLYAMSLCQHNVIANSSFSWWGAWLNQNPNKIVIAPKQWFVAGPQATNDLIPSSWIRL